VVDLGIEMVQGFALCRPLSLEELPGIRCELSLLGKPGSTN